MKKLREIEVKRSVKDILYEALSNLFLLMFLKDNERNRQRIYYIALVFIYFSQIAGFLCSISEVNLKDDYLQYLFLMCESLRITYLLKALDSSIIIGAVLLLLCLYEVILIIYAINLSFTSIKDDVDVLKTQAFKIGTVQIYFEHQKWLYCLPKLDLIFGILFCNGTVDSFGENSRCFAAVKNTDAGLIQYFNIVCALFLLLTTLILNIIIVLIYHNPEPLLEIGLVLTTFITNAAFVIVLGQIIGLFLLVEYFYHFPLMDKNISDIYGWMIIVYQTLVSMLFIREYTSSLKDTNFPITFLIIISILYGILKSFWNNKIIVSMTVDPNRLGDFPQATCLYLEKLCELFEQCTTILSSKLTLFGSLQLHKNNCRDLNCPCKDTQFNEMAGEEKPTISGGMIIDLGKDIKIKGVDFARICCDDSVFEKWFMLFVDYQFEILIQHLIKKRQEIIVQEVCLRYWFFLIKFKKNQIKALYQNKIMNQMLKKKDSFFQTVERSLTNLIESKIKEKDKAHFYSYSQKDRMDAMNNLKFDLMVQSETQKDRLKKILNFSKFVSIQIGNIVTEKCTFMEKLIKGFKSIEELRIQLIQFIELAEYFEKALRIQMQKNNQNIYFLKFSSMMKAYVLFDPLNCRETEQAVEDIINKEKSIDQTTTITSLSILQGNVGSIIASFKNIKENGKILKFSEKIPQIFNYDKGEFQNKESVTDLIPDCIGRLHDQFLMRLIQTGIAKTVRNYRTMFAKDKQGYIFRVKLFINFYFVKQDDFAFSALIINCPSNDMYVILNSNGYIEGISQNFAELVEGQDVDINSYKKLNISAIIPQFVEFMSEFNMKEEYSFLKFKLDVPKDMSRLIQTFMIHHSNFYGSQTNSDKQLKNSSRDQDWKSNVSSFLNQRVVQKGQSYELTLNVKHEMFQDNGKDVLLYILEIQQYVKWEDIYTSEYSNSTGGRSKQSQREAEKNQQHNSIKNQQTSKNESTFFSKPHQENQQLNKDTSLGKEENSQQEHNVSTSDKQKEGESFLRSPKIDSCDNFDKKHPDQRDSNKKILLANYQNLDDSNMPMVQDRKYDEQFLDTHQVNNTLMLTTQNNEEDKENYKLIEMQKTIKNQQEDSTNLQQSQKNQDNLETTVEQSQQQVKQQQKKGQDEDSSVGHESKNQDQQQSISLCDDDDNNQGNDMVRQIGHNNKLPYDQGSKSSVQSSLTNIIKHILDNTTTKQTPPFITVLYYVFIFQFFVFITVVIVLSVTITDSFNNYTKALNEMGRSSKMLIPINQSIISSDILSLKNMNELNPVPSEQYMQLMNMHTRTGYQQYVHNLFNFLDQQVNYQYQRDFLDMTLDVSLVSFQSKVVSKVYFSEYLKQVGESLYDLNRDDYQQKIEVNVDQKYLLTNNLNKTFDLLLESMLKIDEDLGSMSSNIILVNTYSIILAIVLIILSFGFIIPSYNNLKFKSERILMIISRLKEEETNDIMFHLNQIGSKLYSDNDEYLHIDFSNFALREEMELESSQRNNKKKSKRRQNYLFDRILDQKLKFWAFILILIILCVLSVIFFLIVQILFDLNTLEQLTLLFLNTTQIFIYLNQFQTIFGDPADKYKKFIEGSMEFSTATSSHNSILVNNLLKEKGIQYLSNEKLNELVGLREKTLLLAQSYFSSQFIDIQQQSLGQNFQKLIVDISQSNICVLGILNDFYLNFCKSALEGILTQGLQPTVSTIIQKISNQINIFKDFSLFVQSKEYLDGLVVEQLLTNVMNYIVDQFEQENSNIKSSYLNSLILILSLGSLIYVLIFFIVIVIYLNKLKKEYLSIKRAIQLVPYKRLTEVINQSYYIDNQIQ